MRALLIDDSRTMREMIRSVLTPLRLDEVEEADDAPEGLAALDAGEPGLVIVDGGIDGALDLVREARRRDGSVPIVMISADTGDDRVATARDAGVDRYVVKPCTPDVLSQSLAEAIQGAGGPAA